MPIPARCGFCRDLPSPSLYEKISLVNVRSVFFNVSLAPMFPNCDNASPATSQICDAAQVDEDIRRFEHDLIRVRTPVLEASADAGRGCGDLPIEGHRAVAAAQLGRVESLTGGLHEIGHVCKWGLGTVRRAADGDRLLGVIRSDDMPGVAERHHDALAYA